MVSLPFTVSECFFSTSVYVGCIWRCVQQLEDVSTARSFSGKMRELKAYSARRDVDFGKGIGTKPVYLLYVLPPLLPVYVSTQEIPTSILQVQLKELLCISLTLSFSLLISMK
jgi:hypothetical protein